MLALLLGLLHICYTVAVLHEQCCIVAVCMYAYVCAVCRYRTLLHDCHQCYVSQRGLLLTPSVAASIEELKAVHGSNHSGLVCGGGGGGGGEALKRGV